MADRQVGGDDVVGRLQVRLLVTVLQRHVPHTLAGVLRDGAMHRMNDVVDLVDHLLGQPLLHRLLKVLAIVELARRVRVLVETTLAHGARVEAGRLVLVHQVIVHLLHALDGDLLERPASVLRPLRPLLGGAQRSTNRALPKFDQRV
eukprot:3280998-Prymnesium_polylepis.1